MNEKGNVTNVDFENSNATSLLNEMLKQIVKERGLTSKLNVRVQEYKKRLLNHYQALGLLENIEKIIEKMEEHEKKMYEWGDYDIIRFLSCNKCEKVRKQDSFYRLNVWEQVVDHMMRLLIRAQKNSGGEKASIESGIQDELERVREKVWKAYNNEKTPYSFNTLERWVSICARYYNRILELSYEKNEIGRYKLEEIDKVIEIMEKSIDEIRPNVARDLKIMGYSGYYLASLNRKLSECCWKTDFSISAEISNEAKNLCGKIDALVKEKVGKDLIVYKDYKEEIASYVKRNYEYFLIREIGLFLAYLEKSNMKESRTEEITQYYNFLVECLDVIECTQFWEEKRKKICDSVIKVMDKLESEKMVEKQSVEAPAEDNEEKSKEGDEIVIVVSPWGSEELIVMKSYFKCSNEQRDILLQCIFLKKYKKEIEKVKFKGNEVFGSRVEDYEAAIIKEITKSCSDIKLKKELESNEDQLSINLLPYFWLDYQGIAEAAKSNDKSKSHIIPYSY